MTSPVDSIYLSCALAKIFIQLLLIYLLAVFITGSGNVFKLDFMIAAVLVSPLFQTNGYRSFMGIIDPSPTYTFFYALPCAVLLLYFLPLFRQYFHGRELKTKYLSYILWIPLSFVLCLSGPLNPGVVLIVSLLLFVHTIHRNFRPLPEKRLGNRFVQAVRRIPNDYWFFLIIPSLLSIYSLYLGTYNSVSVARQLPLLELYRKLPGGLYSLLTSKPGFPVLLLILAINFILLHRHFRSDQLIGSTDRISRSDQFKWIGIFALCYILLLPLGGYRDYRPNIIRYDTFLPITLSLMYLFGSSTLFLIKNLVKKQLAWYLPLIVLVAGIYTNADEPEFNKNQCERNALEKIAAASDSPVALPPGCTVLSWEKTITPSQADLNAQLLTLWGITDVPKSYYFTVPGN